MNTIYGFLANGRAARLVTLGTLYAGGSMVGLWLAYELRFDFDVPETLGASLGAVLLWVTALKLAVLYAFGQFEDSLSYFSTPDLKRILGVCVASACFVAFGYEYVAMPWAPPRSVVLIDALLGGLILCSGRLGIRFFRERFLTPQTRGMKRPRRVGVIGAGDTGTALARDLLAKGWLGLRPVAFFDDHRRPGSRVHGIAVWGPPEWLAEKGLGARLDEVVIAMPSVRPARLREIVEVVQKSGVRFRTIPSMGQLATGRVSVSSLRAVQIEDLLGRDVVEIGSENVRSLLVGRVVMVTGAGGSIGSELCRQIAAMEPARLLLVERSEAALFPIEQELLEMGQGGRVEAVVADVTDAVRMGAVFGTHKPAVVFHAAAHKHVPMMEGQPAEALRNNVLGTAQVAELAWRHGTGLFLLVSTDKAINPTNVMGATKRLAEKVVQGLQQREGGCTRFVAVRFGNVLGSSGSVVPIFTRQIAAGGPVKVTHPEVTRYFMTIPEAVSLVLQSAAQAEGGEIFVLDMGEPVKIADLARQMIELSGLRPGEDIEVVFTGLRPGEKLFEELSHRSENVLATEHPKILRLRGEPARYGAMKAILESLATVLPVASCDELKVLLKRVVPEYQPQMGGVRGAGCVVGGGGEAAGELVGAGEAQIQAGGALKAGLG